MHRKCLTCETLFDAGATTGAYCGLECRKEGKRKSNRKHYRGNREKAFASAARWKRANREKCRAANRKYRAENLEKMKAYQRDWYHRNVDSHRKTNMAWREANPEKVKATMRKHDKARSMAAKVAKQFRPDIFSGSRGRDRNRSAALIFCERFGITREQLLER